MTGVQALERAAKRLPMTAGHVERREFEYIRHGTKALIAGFNVATGTVFGTVGDTRTEEDFTAFMKELFASTALATRWRVVCDNLNTHMSEGVVRLVAVPGPELVVVVVLNTGCGKVGVEALEVLVGGSRTTM